MTSCKFTTRGILFLVGVSLLLSSKGKSAETLSAVVHNDTVTIWDRNLEFTCNSRFQFELRLSQDTLEVTEVDTATMHTTCVCTFQLSVSEVGLAAGHYIVPVYRRYYLRYPDDSTHFVGMTEFTIGPPSTPAAVWSYQSACNQSDQVVPNSVLAPGEFVLEQCYPNPFNPTTRIVFSIPWRSHVMLEVYDLLGQRVAVLVDGVLEAGRHTRSVDAANFASGMYFCRMYADGFTETKKMVVER